MRPGLLALPRRLTLQQLLTLRLWQQHFEDVALYRKPCPVNVANMVLGMLKNDEHAIKVYKLDCGPKAAYSVATRTRYGHMLKLVSLDLRSASALACQRSFGFRAPTVKEFANNMRSV